MNPELTLKPLIHQISFAGVVAGQKEDNDVNETPLAKVNLCKNYAIIILNCCQPQNRTIDPKQIAKQSYMLREAAVNILTDLYAPHLINLHEFNAFAVFQNHYLHSWLIFM